MTVNVKLYIICRLAQQTKWSVSEEASSRFPSEVEFFWSTSDAQSHP